MRTRLIGVDAPEANETEQLEWDVCEPAGTGRPMANLVILPEGHAPVLTVRPATKYQTTFLAASGRRGKRGRGLWSEPEVNPASATACLDASPQSARNSASPRGAFAARAPVSRYAVIRCEGTTGGRCSTSPQLGDASVDWLLRGDGRPPEGPRKWDDAVRLLRAPCRDLAARAPGHGR
jgi:hypothetical protein